VLDLQTFQSTHICTVHILQVKRLNGQIWWDEIIFHWRVHLHNVPTSAASETGLWHCCLMFAGQIRQMGLSRIPQVSQDPVDHHFRIKMAIWGLYRYTLFQTRPEQLSKSASDPHGGPKYIACHCCPAANVHVDDSSFHSNICGPLQGTIWKMPLNTSAHPIFHNRSWWESHVDRTVVDGPKTWSMKGTLR
jgi:hypothetical protein